MGHRHIARVIAAARDAGVPHEPWLAWARERAQLDGPDVAADLAAIGASTEPTWTVAPVIVALDERGRLVGWWRRRVQGWRGDGPPPTPSRR